MFRKCVVFILCAVFALSTLPSVFAVTDLKQTIGNGTVLSSLSLSGDAFYYPNSDNQNEVFEQYSKRSASSDLQIKYDSSSHKLQIVMDINDNGKEVEVNAEGEVYHNITVDYDKSAISDMNTLSSEYTVVFFQIFEDNEGHKTKIITERNADGHVFIVIASIQKNLFNEIYRDSLNNPISDEMFYSLVLNIEKSPNYGTPDMEEEVFEVTGEVSLEAQREGVSLTRAAYNSRQEWVSFFNQLYANRNSSPKALSTYTTNLDMSIITGMNNSNTNRQHKYTQGSNYLVQRIGIYSPVYNIYTIFITIHAIDVIATGINTNMKFGLYSRVGETLNMSTCRAELSGNKANIKCIIANSGDLLRHSADINIALSDSTNWLNTVSRHARILQYDDAWDLAIFALGNIKYIKDIIQIISLWDAVFGDYNIAIPTSDLWHWNGQSSTKVNAASLRLFDDNPLRDNGDFMEINAYAANTRDIPSTYFRWSSGCFLFP